MCRFFLTGLVVVLATCGCSREAAQQPGDSPSQPNTVAEIPGTPYGDFVIGDPVEHENLTIFPISSKTPKNVDRFITLDEGIAAGTVKIMEVGAHEQEVESIDADEFAERPEQDVDTPPTDSGRTSSGGANVPQSFGRNVENPFGEASGEVDGDVNMLLVLNSSDMPLYLMPGEVIYGGKQDRTVGEEFVIQPGKNPVPIDVYCVEQGRWGGRSIAQTVEHLAYSDASFSNLSLAISQTQEVEASAEEAARGKFVASVGQLNKDTRLAVQLGEGQRAVWDNVAKANADVGNDAESGNLAAAYLDSDIVNDLEPYIEELTTVGETKQIVGIAVAVNGKMLSVDVFESTPLFRKFWPKLLKSHALDAVAAANTDEPPEAVCSTDDCLAFLKDAESSEAELHDLEDGQKMARRDSARAVSFSYYDQETAAAMPSEQSAAMGGGGGFGGGVHSSVLAH